MRIIEHREREFPDDLEGRMNSILNVINTELKAVTLLHLDDVPTDGSGIKARIRESVGRNCYLPLANAFISYCHETLFPIGTVAEEDVIYEDVESIITGYKLTDAGRKYGLPIVAFTLDYVVKNNRSMYEILGSTVSHGKSRSPFNRVRILEALRSKDYQSQHLDEEQDPGGLQRHLKALKDLGFVDFKTFGESSNVRINYEWTGIKNSSEIQPLYGQPAFTFKIAKLFEQEKRLSYKELCKILNYSNRRLVCSILKHLTAEGVLHQDKEYDREALSKISLLDEGRFFLESYSDKLKDALNDRFFLSYMKNLLNSFRENESDLNIFSVQAINLYKQISPHINSSSLEERQEQIIDFLGENPGMRYLEISKSINISSPSNYIAPLVKSGILRKEREGVMVRYYLNKKI